MKMELRKVTAIIRSNMLQQVEERLQDLGVKGLSVTNVKGYGEYANFFTHSWLVTHSRIEIFTERKRSEEIAKAIMDTAHCGIEGDGIVVILPVEKVYRIRTKALAKPGEI
jgi:nitrogen regulatory protein P-II 1